MFAVEVSDQIMIAHSFRGAVFGPAQELHGATFVVRVAFMAQRLDDNGIVIDIGRAHEALKSVLAPLNYRNLDDLPQFKGINTTTEFVTSHVFDALADLARAAVAKGFSAFKSMAVPPTGPLEGMTPVLAAEQAVAKMRDAVGPAIDIMVDCHARPSPAMGMLFAKALEPYRLFFLEEPCWPEEYQALSHINASVATPIATGGSATMIPTTGTGVAAAA